MTVRWAWIQGTIGDVPTYPANDDRLVLNAILDEGIVRGCKPTAGDPSRDVDIGPGQFVIEGDDVSNGGTVYVGTITATETVAISAAPVSGTRIDLVVAQVRDLEAGGSAGNDIILTVVDGVVDAGVAPAVPDSAIPICEVSMTAGQTAVTAAQVTDRRLQATTKEPVGSIRLWYGPSNKIPAKYALLTTGAASNVTIGAFGDYPDLADLLGVSAGDITVAHFRGRSPIGINSADTAIDTVGETAGAATVTIATGNLPAHTHDLGNHTHSGTTSTESATHTHSGTTDTGGSHSHSTTDAGHSHGVTDPGHDHASDVSEIGGTTSGSTDVTPATSPFGDFTLDDTRSATTGVTVNSATTGLTIGTASAHTHTFTTGSASATHTHTVTTGAPSSNTSGSTGSGTALSILHPVVALHVLIRVL